MPDKFDREILRALHDALRADANAPEPEGWRDAPVIDGWSCSTPNGTEMSVSGYVYASGKFPEGTYMWTSAIASFDHGARFVHTQNSIYRLGWQARGVADQNGVNWPPILTLAKQQTWLAAFREAAALVGESLPPEAAARLQTFAPMEGADEIDGKYRCGDVAKAMYAAKRVHVAAAFHLLAARTSSPGDVKVVAANLSAAVAERGFVPHDIRFPSKPERDIADAWSIMAEAGYAAMDALGVPEDAVATAHRMRDVARAFGLKAAKQSESLDPEILDDEEDEDTSPGDGVIVIREIGGADFTTSGREVKAAFKKMIGIPVPLAPVPDLAAVRAELVAEFPHCSEQIDVVLSDMHDSAHVRLRPTLFVGDPGGGKSRLCRRLSETLRAGLQRYEGGGSSDNAFAGTSRRWHSGSHCIPLEAIRRHFIANPIVMVDEIDKAASGRNSGGTLEEAILAFLEKETASAYFDPLIESSIDLSHVSYVLTANDDTRLPSPLRDRLRIVRLPRPTAEHMPALARGIVRDFSAGADVRWFPDLSSDELWIAERLWCGGSVRRLADIVGRIVAKRSEMRH